MTQFLENRLLYLVFEKSATTEYDQQTIICIASFSVVEDKVELCKQLFGALQEATRMEEGNISCDLYLDERSVGKFALMGEWASTEYLQAHLASRHMANFNSALKHDHGIQLQPPAIKFYKFVQ